MEQSELTAGFQARNCAREMPAWVARSVQERPAVTRDHLLQLSGEPDMVGPGGVGFVGAAVLVVGDTVVVSSSSPEIPTQ